MYCYRWKVLLAKVKFWELHCSLHELIKEKLDFSDIVKRKPDCKVIK